MGHSILEVDIMAESGVLSRRFSGSIPRDTAALARDARAFLDIDESILKALGEDLAVYPGFLSEEAMMEVILRHLPGEERARRLVRVLTIADALTHAGGRLASLLERVSHRLVPQEEQDPCSPQYPSELVPTSPQRAPLLTLQDSAAAPGIRLGALDALIESPQEADAVSYLVDELARPDLEPEWRDAVVGAVEVIHLPPEHWARVGDLLLRHATELQTQLEGRDKVVWSALRRAASLLAPENAERLLPFLTASGSVDTRAVALQCVTRVYELAPPDSVPVALADRAAAFAVKFLDQDVFAAGEPSLIARNAVAALAAIGDSRLLHVAGLVSALARPWLTQRVRKELARIGQGWHDRGVRDDHPAVVNLHAALAGLA